MKELQVFNSEDFGQVRTIIINDVPFFVGKDVADILGYGNSRQALKTNVADDDKDVHVVDTPSGAQRMTIINESGLYSLIFGSKLEKAKQFKRWVTSEVLPSLRKNGTYSVTTTCQYPVSPAAMESATNAGRLFERLMKRQGVPPYEIAMAVRSIFLQAGIDIPDYVARIPEYEQMVLPFGKDGEVARYGISN